MTDESRRPGQTGLHEFWRGTRIGFNRPSYSGIMRIDGRYQMVEAPPR